jgi:hypothetical protein
VFGGNRGRVVCLLELLGLKCLFWFSVQQGKVFGNSDGRSTCDQVEN